MPLHQNRAILIGETLLRALALTTLAVKHLMDGEMQRINAAHAAGLARSGLYVGFGRADRVFWIRKIADSPESDKRPFVIDTAHWDGRACIRYHGDERSGDHRLDLVKFWDKIFQRQAQNS